MQRGEVFLVEFEPARGADVDKRRPAVLVTNAGANERAPVLGRGLLAVVPLTSSVDAVYPFQVFLPATETGLDADSKAQAEQIRSLDVSRFGRRIARVPIDRMIEIDEAICRHLDL